MRTSYSYHRASSLSKHSGKAHYLGILLALTLLSCGGNRGEEKIIGVDFSNRTEVDDTSSDTSSVRPLKVAIAAMTSPRETFHHYRELLDYVSDQLGRSVSLEQRKTYKEVNELLRSGEVDVAFICTGAYAEIKRAVDILTVPEIDGTATYQAYVLVGADSPARVFWDLRGLSFAFTDPLSNSGYLEAVRRTRKLGYSLEEFFGHTLFTYGHDYSIAAVANGVVDAATVDGLIYKYLKDRNPEAVKNVRILLRSRPYGMPPVVVRRAVETGTKDQLRSIFERMNQTDRGLEILRELRIDRFVPGYLSAYEDISLERPQ